MKVFVTGASGFVGSAVVADLEKAGHEVLGLARSEAAAKTLESLGAKAHRGSLEDLDSLRSGAAACDAVLHLGFIHDFSKFEHSCAVEKRVVETLGSAVAGSAKPLVVTSGTALLSPGRL